VRGGFGLYLPPPARKYFLNRAKIMIFLFGPEKSVIFFRMLPKFIV
jgi:hypothetical protein